MFISHTSLRKLFPTCVVTKQWMECILFCHLMIIDSLKNLIEADDEQVSETFSAVYLSSFFFSFFLIFGKIFFSLHKQQSWLRKNINWFPDLRNPRQHKRHRDVLLCPRNAVDYFLQDFLFNFNFWQNILIECTDTVGTRCFPNGRTFKLFPFTFCPHHRLTFAPVEASARLLWLTTWLRDQGCDGCQENKQLSFPSVFPTAQPGEAESEREEGRHPLSSKGTSGWFSRSPLGHLPASGFAFSPLAPQSCPRDALTTRCPTGAPCDSEMEETGFAATFFFTSFSEACDLSALRVSAWDTRRGKNT